MTILEGVVLRSTIMVNGEQSVTKAGPSRLQKWLVGSSASKLRCIQPNEPSLVKDLDR